MLHISRQDQFCLLGTGDKLQISAECSFSYLHDFSDRTRIFAALREGNVGRLDECVTSGHCPDWENLVDNGQTVDIAAVSSGNASMVDYVLQHGGRNAYLRGPEDIVPPPYQLAIQRGFADVIDVLLKHDLSLEEQDRDGITPLQMALIHRDYPTLEKLYSAGAGINTQDWEGNTPLHFAVRNRDRFAVQWLLKRHALPNAQTVKDQWSPLHYAVLWGEIDIAGELMDYGAWVNLRDARGMSPLQLAFTYKHIPLVMVFRKKAPRAHEMLKKSLSIEQSLALRDVQPVASFAVDSHSMQLLEIGDQAIRTTRQQIAQIGNQQLHTEIFDGCNATRLLQMRQLRSLMPYPKVQPWYTAMAVSRLAVAMGVGNCRELAGVAFFELLPKLNDQYTIELVAHDIYDHVFVVVRTNEHEVMVVDPWPMYPHATQPLDFHMLNHDTRKKMYGVENQEDRSNVSNSRIVDILNVQMNNRSSGSYLNIDSTSGFRVTLRMRGIKGNPQKLDELQLVQAHIDKWAADVCLQQDYIFVFPYETRNTVMYGRQVLWPTYLGGPVRYYADTRLDS